MEINLTGGLNNKLFCFFSACEIAIRHHTKILEPKLGWKRKILFSEIYDLDLFNANMRPYNNGKDLLVQDTDKDKHEIVANKQDLWGLSARTITKMRHECTISRKSSLTTVLSSLNLNKQNKTYANQFKVENTNSLQIRIEDDWVAYSKEKQKEIGENEVLLIELHDLIDYYMQFSGESIFFTTGQNHQYVKNQFSSKNINSDFFYDDCLEYEVNAAINFEICCRSKNFIGLTRSTFSNLVALRRALCNKDNSYIYNLNNKIIRRVDSGLQHIPGEAISKPTNFSD